MDYTIIEFGKEEEFFSKEVLTSFAESFKNDVLPLQHLQNGKHSLAGMEFENQPTLEGKTVNVWAEMMGTTEGKLLNVNFIEIVIYDSKSKPDVVLDRISKFKNNRHTINLNKE